MPIQPWRGPGPKFTGEGLANGLVGFLGQFAQSKQEADLLEEKRKRAAAAEQMQRQAMQFNQNMATEQLGLERQRTNQAQTNADRNFGLQKDEFALGTQRLANEQATSLANVNARKQDLANDQQRIQDARSQPYRQADASLGEDQKRAASIGMWNMMQDLIEQGMTKVQALAEVYKSPEFAPWIKKGARPTPQEPSRSRGGMSDESYFDRSSFTGQRNMLLKQHDAMMDPNNGVGAGRAFVPAYFSARQTLLRYLERGQPPPADVVTSVVQAYRALAQNQDAVREFGFNPKVTDDQLLQMFGIPAPQYGPQMQ